MNTLVWSDDTARLVKTNPMAYVLFSPPETQMATIQANDDRAALLQALEVLCEDERADSAAERSYARRLNEVGIEYG